MGLGQPIVNDAGFLSSLIKMDELQICYYSRNLATGAAFAEQGFIYLIRIFAHILVLDHSTHLVTFCVRINQSAFIHKVLNHSQRHLEALNKINEK